MPTTPAQTSNGFCKGFREVAVAGWEEKGMIDEINERDPNGPLMTTTKGYLIPPFGNE
ncbi:predicted protein [Histoplasma mississippiense (nom. inval.)]|uniref:predicted protein n=1 Tax=Ajellomyces capsulatus (strain NAm1 / WU24) TaxID=2059318 RepID=UPI000157D1E7|nr:predicted protein [Histoplasma mississippiense (nom. inval.)]EDN04347.1 predicted protein [Histoplasma mississippiense (nom. inval.)]